MARLEGKDGLIVGVAAGSGFVAAAAERGGADFVLAINAARLRNMGAPSVACMLPLADASAMAARYACREVLPLVRIPVLLGATCWRDGFDPGAEALNALSQGFAGLVNFPPSGLYPPAMRDRLEGAGIGFSAELRMLGAAQARGGYALAYCMSLAEARQAARAGIANVLLNFGWNSGGALSPTPRLTLDEAAVMAAAVSRQVCRERPDARILLEGGPVVSEGDLAAVLQTAQIDGYIGGSTIERQPLERSIADQIARFRQAHDRVRKPKDPGRRIRALQRRAGFAGESPALLAFLETLDASSRLRQPLTYLALPPGESADGLLRVLAGRTGGTRRSPLRRLDPEVFGSAREAMEGLFGGPGGAGLCGDPNLEILALDRPETLPRSVQRRIAEHAHGAASGPRLVLIGRADGAFDARLALEPALVRQTEAAVLRVPPLRERFPDVAATLAAEAERQGAALDFSPAAIRFLTGYSWPGNMAELATLCQFFAGRPGPGSIPRDAVEAWVGEHSGTASDATLPDPRGELIGALLRNGFRKGQTAEALGISRKTLYNRMKRYGIG